MKKASLFLLILLFALTPFLFSTLKAHAIISVVQSASGTCSNVIGSPTGPNFVYTCNVPFGMSPTVGNTIAIVASVYNDTTASSGVTESYPGNQFYFGTSTPILGNGGGGSQPDGFYKFIFFGDVVVSGGNIGDIISGAVNVQLAVSGAISSEAENFAVYEVELANVNASNIVGGAPFSASTNAYPNTSGFTLLASSSSTFALGMVVPQSDHTATPNATFSHTNLAGLNSVTTAQYHLFGASASPSTLFDINGVTGSVPWIYTGMILGEEMAGPPGPTTTQTVIKVVACNFYETQCWWEPMLFYGMYVGLWVGIGATMQLRARSLTYLFTAAFSYASLYLVLLGELPYPFALIAFAGAVVYGLRLDGLF